MKLNPAFVDRTESLFGKERFERFIAALDCEPVVSIRYNASKQAPDSDNSVVPWAANGRYLASRPVFTADPLFHAGCYYVQEASSMFLEQFVKRYIDAPVRALDLCAAPGGKSMLMVARYLPQSHTANEVNASRRGILRQNMQQCGVPNVEVTGLRPDQWATEGRQFDLLLADAPCSGQSLLCKGIKNPGCLGAQMVNGNAKRQKGILLSAVQCVAPGGHIVYTTCTYDPEENEKVMAYILKRNPEWQAVEVPLLAPFRSTLSHFPSYRLLPAHGFGAGGFCCLLQKNK